MDKETYFVEEFIEWMIKSDIFADFREDVIEIDGKYTIHENVSDVILFDNEGNRAANKKKNAIAINCNVGIPDYETGASATAHTDVSYPFENYTMEFTIVGINNHKIIKKQTRFIKKMFRAFRGELYLDLNQDEPSMLVDMQEIKELKDTLKPAELDKATNSTIIKSRLDDQSYDKTDDGEYEYSVSLLNFYNTAT